VLSTHQVQLGQLIRMVREGLYHIKGEKTHFIGVTPDKKVLPHKVLSGIEAGISETVSVHTNLKSNSDLNMV
jgi:hypothetical protein